MQVILDLKNHTSTFHAACNFCPIVKTQHAGSLLTIARGLYKQGWIMRQETTKDSEGSDILTRVTVTHPRTIDAMGRNM